jgi:2',3'-cyclic-nucleotide 2'-phosphodiesterase (5'-nucleotidase family)
MVGGTPLDVNKTYTVASHNYMLKSGGDGLTMFKGSKVIRDEVITDVDLLSSYIRNQLGGNVGNDYANPLGQGRITIK